MASFSICPLIDQRCFLGINDDSTPGCIIVSLGKNIIMRFRLSDQKQLSSWTTKDKLSTPVFYDSVREDYFAVFNGELISRWPKDTKCINNRSGKYKLPWTIHSVHCLPGIRPVLLFKNGTLALLGTDNKKSITVVRNDVLPKGEVVESRAFSFLGRNYLCFLIKDDKSTTLEFSPISESDDNLFRYQMTRKESDSKLCCFTVVEDKLMTLWSDKCLYIYSLNGSDRSSEEFPGRCITSFTNINCTLPCVMLALDNHVAVYGADANGEGAKVVWVEANFGVIQNTLHLKIYSNHPRMWKVTPSYLITTVGQYLTVIPYKLKNTPKLDSLLAAAYSQEDSDILVATVSWEKPKKVKSKKGKKEEFMDETEPLTVDKPKSEVHMKVSKGYPECFLGQEFVGDLLEQGKIEEAVTNLNNLSDIPDKYIIDTVFTCLNLNNDNSRDLLYQVLSFPLLCDNDTLSYIRDKVSFESIISLLKAISERLEEDPDNSALFRWLSLLLDSHYQQYLFNKDQNVIKQIESLKDQIDSFICGTKELMDLYKLLIGTSKLKVGSKSSVQYSVDKFMLF